ncbi:MAG: tail fiber domain-containing protein, partial [Acidimicrobiia bacterium]|nr:tail fiber domain-containing protein [Acidimicrobiia bacterium]
PWATDGGTVSYTGGNVGIGTTQPSTVLEVSRTTGDTEIGIVGGDGGRRWTLQSSNGLEPDLGGSFQIIDRTANEARLVINDMGHVGIGTPYPDRALVVVGDTGLFGDVRLGTGFPPSNTIVDGNTLLNGNVGINPYPFAPQDRLHVVGNVLVNNGTVRLESGHLQVDLGDVLIETGRIRFGVSNDNSDPISIARANISSDYSALVINIGDNPGAGVPPGDDLIIQAGGSNQFIFRSNGQAAKTGVPFWDTISDRRAKHDIEPLTGVLDRLMQLEGRVFSYNEPNQPGAREGRCIGFIAQEVEPIFPDWVSTDREGMKIMHTAGFEALAVEAMRELRAEKDAELKAIRGENESLRQENEALRDRLDAVENLLDTLVREAALEKSH